MNALVDKALLIEDELIQELHVIECNPLADNAMSRSVFEKLNEFTADEKTTNIPTFEINEKLVLTNVDLKVADNVDGVPVGRAFQNIFGELVIGVTKDKAIIVKLYKDED